jgi:hypothetical protein
MARLLDLPQQRGYFWWQVQYAYLPQGCGIHLWKTCHEAVRKL